jgi:hypothetical protein
MAVEFEIVKLTKFSGNKASIYAIKPLSEKITLFSKFTDKYKNSFKSEISEIYKILNLIGKTAGAREQFFVLNEGEPADGVCALFDENKRLRLYCIRYGMCLIILGGGGYKSKKLQAFQEDEKLKGENYLLREISKRITKRIRNREIIFIEDGKEFSGNIIFKSDE